VAISQLIRAPGQRPTNWIQQIYRDTGILVPDALKLAEEKTDRFGDKSQWRDAIQLNAM